MTTLNPINSNQTLSTTSDVTFNSLSLTSPLALAKGGTGSVISPANNSIFATNGSGIVGLTTSLPTAVQVSTTSLANGSGASSSTFWRGDGTWSTPIGASFTAPTLQSFLSGSGTYTTPVGVLYLRVVMLGGGGGGAGGGGAGATGGINGVASTFGTSLLTANGGGEGTIPSFGTSAIGGVAVINSPAIGIKVNGSGGPSGDFTGSTLTVSGQSGGPSAVGGSGAGQENGSGQNAAVNSGSGGSGGGATAGGAGGGGASGAYIDALIYTPSSTYSYSVGGGGAGGTGGTAGVNGSNGAAGAIYVYEYYQ